MATKRKKKIVKSSSKISKYLLQMVYVRSSYFDWLKNMAAGCCSHYFLCHYRGNFKNFFLSEIARLSAVTRKQKLCDLGSHKTFADFNLQDMTYAPENVVTSGLGCVFGLGVVYL